MDDDRPVVDLLRLFQRPHKHRHVMAVDISYVLKAQLIDECTRQNSGGDGILHRLCRSAESSAEMRNAFQRIADLFFQMLVTLRFLDAVKISA